MSGFGDHACAFPPRGLPASQFAISEMSPWAPPAGQKERKKVARWKKGYSFHCSTRPISWLSPTM